ncbi:MAG: enoyl-CoA hydratase/isomerase family protein [SAR324 cluster bacterium]|nr:enoyl-CoA hydratase/isomerase family protein [SAR324 cluster bacterium]
MSENRLSSELGTYVETRQEAVEDRGQVGTITVKGKTHLNLIGRSMILQLKESFEKVFEIEDLRTIILTGWGNASFIGGVDIAEMEGLNEKSARIFIRELHELCSTIRKARVPVFAKIRGYCLGGGLEIAAACDFRFASPSSKFGMPEVRVGIPSVIEAALLPRLIGWGKTRELVLLGTMLNADQAKSCGLIEGLASEENLDQFVWERVKNIFDAGPNAIRLQKELIQKWERLSLEEAIETGIDFFARAYETDEPQRMMQSFLNRQK